MGAEEVKLIQLVSNGGSFVFLVVIGVWLMWLMPKRWAKADEQAEARRLSDVTVAEATKATVELIEAAHDTRLQKLLETFVADQRYEREQCAQLFRNLEEGQRRQLAGLEQVMRALPGRQGNIKRDQT
jgi:hypothetical protein